MATIEEYEPGYLPDALMGTAGTGGDLCYVSTGSILTHKSAATGTGVTNAFAGILSTNTVAGSKAAIVCDKVVQLEKHAAANKIEIGDAIYATKSSNKVGTLAGGTSIGVAVKQSATTDTYVSVQLIPFWRMGVSGFHA